MSKFIMPSSGWIDEDGNLIDCPDASTDFLITGLVYRKWYNPMRYVLGKLNKKKCIGRFI